MDNLLVHINNSIILAYRNDRQGTMKEMEQVVPGLAAAPMTPAFVAALTKTLAAMEKGDLYELGNCLKYDIMNPQPRPQGSFSEEERRAYAVQVWSEQFETMAVRRAACFFGAADSPYLAALDGRLSEESFVIAFDPQGEETIEDLKSELTANIDFYLLENMIVTCEPGSELAFPERYAEFLHAINENRERILVNKNTLNRFRNDAVKNVITNLHILKECNLISELGPDGFGIGQPDCADRLKRILPRDIPVIIVSAGPSLDLNVELLREAKGHCLIFAVDTALKYLLQRDIIPDIGITVEPIKPMANYEDGRCFDIPHVFDCESNPDIVGRHRTRKFIYNCRDYVKRLFEEAGKTVPNDVASGGSVATAAFAVCYQLGMKHIILIGQDLAYSGEATHAGGVESAGINGTIGYTMVESIDGRQVRTRSDWIGYKRWFENAIRTVNAQGLDMEVTDATEGGALIEGTKVMTLREAIDTYCAGVDYDFSRALETLPAFLNDKEYAKVLNEINTSFDELTPVKEAACKAAGLCADTIGAYERTGALPEPLIAEAVNKARTLAEEAMLYPLINNYAVSDIADEVGRLRTQDTSPVSLFRQQKLAFEAIASACDYLLGLTRGI